MLATWHFHIEISSKCTLRCPRCARQEVPDTLINTELDLAFFKRNFTKQFVQDHVEKITFCGEDDLVGRKCRESIVSLGGFSKEVETQNREKQNGG